MQQVLHFGRWLKQLRAEQDLTQEALADRVGCATQTVRMIEGGQRRPSRDLAERFADVLDVPAAERATFLQLARAKPAAREAAGEASLRPSTRPP